MQQFPVKEIGDVTLIKVGSKSLAGLGAYQFQEFIDSLIDKGRRKIVIDLARNASVVDSGALSSVARAGAKLAEAGILYLVISHPVDLVKIATHPTLVQMFEPQGFWRFIYHPRILALFGKATRLEEALFFLGEEEGATEEVFV